ncbi:MAG: nitroreductase family protein [Candidatus Lokiarchaeota archaeon]
MKDDLIKEILECGTYALNEENNQPWIIKVNVITHPTVKQMISEFAEDKYQEILTEAYVNLVIFLDLNSSTNRTKDLQAIGAFIQNILLAAHAIDGLGSVWIENIIAHNEKILEIFKLSKNKYELMGVIAMGPIEETKKKENNSKEVKPVDQFTDWF